MLEHILDILAPHYCVGCTNEGNLLCLYCKEMVIDSAPSACLFCWQPVQITGVCGPCSVRTGISAAWAAALLEDPFKKLVHSYKFERTRAAKDEFVKLMVDRLPYNFTTDIVVNIPTIASHQRQRGYDHALLLSTGVAGRIKSRHTQPLVRDSTTVQLGKSQRERFKQAEKMFKLRGNVDISGKSVLLVDDVMTTGATLQAAAKKMHEAGASQVYALVAAREPLEQMQ